MSDKIPPRRSRRLSVAPTPTAVPPIPGPDALAADETRAAIERYHIAEARARDATERYRRSGAGADDVPQDLSMEWERWTDAATGHECDAETHLINVVRCWTTKGNYFHERSPRLCGIISGGRLYVAAPSVDYVDDQLIVLDLADVVDLDAVAPTRRRPNI